MPSYKITIMERPLKRQRLALGSLGTDDEDELDCEPGELNQRRDPVYQLHQARARASNKLKSRFEDIFAKYEKDFTGVGDEIDLRTGEVVVNNGHLQSITGVQEFGEGDEGDRGEDADADAQLSGNDRPVHGTGYEALGNDSSDAVVQRNPWEVTGSGLDSLRPAAGVGGLPRPSSMMLPAHESFMPPVQAFGSWGYGPSQVVDPAWQAPELPRSAFRSPRSAAQAQRHIFGTGQTTKVTRRSLLEPRSQDGDEDDDVLLGVSDNILGKKESPLIKSKFPAVGSSPNNDPGLHEMIQDVIENIADTSPSVEQSRKGAPGTKPPTKSRMKPVPSDADINCKQGKGQTSENRKSSTGKAKAVSFSRKNGKNFYNKGQGRQIAGIAPAKATTARKKRQPKIHNTQRTAGSTAAPDPAGVKEDFFLDVTGNTPVKPAGQTLYVEIKARKVDQIDSFARDQDDNGSKTVDRGSPGVDVSDQTLQPSVYGPLDAEGRAADPPNEDWAVEPSINRCSPETVSSRIDDEPSQRKRTDPAFSLPDAGILLSGEKKRMSAAAGIDDQALKESRPSVPQKQAKERFERNVVDPSYAFSDEENLLPRRKRNNRRDPEPTTRASHDAQDASRLGKKTKAEKFPQTAVAFEASNEEKRNGATPAPPQPIVERDAANDATNASKSSEEQRLGQIISDEPRAVPPSVSHREARRKRPEKPAVKQPKQQPTGMLQPRSLRDRSRDKTGNGPHGPSELGHRSPAAVASVPALAGEEEPPSTKPPKTAEPTPMPPSTPKLKSKSRSEKTAISSSGLISLLSDDDDEEDEISFNLADFTPSGHHRILALRPHHHQPATSSTGKKRRVASLLFGPASTSKVTKHSTQGSDDKNRKKGRRSTNTLAGSVVKARRASPRAPSPAVSVVQTPGGTKRRCGEDGFRCERDFCFVCISI